MKKFNPSINDLKSQNNRAGYFVTILSILFYSLGFSLDTISYIKNEQSFLLWINSPVLLIMISSFVYLMFSRRFWNYILITVYFLIEINLVFSIWHRIAVQEDVTNNITSNMLIGLVIVATSAYALKSIWTYIYATILAIGYVSTALITREAYLMGNIFMTPTILLGTAFVTHTYIRIYKSTQKRAIESEDEVLRLCEMMNSEKDKVRCSIDMLKEKAQAQNVDLSDDFRRILKSINYDLPEVVLEYTQKVSSNENLFFNRLLSIHPNLTSNELRLCYMLVQNMSTKEIAQKTSCATNSVKVFRSRLRSKLKLESKTNLVSYLKNIEIEATGLET